MESVLQPLVGMVMAHRKPEVALRMVNEALTFANKAKERWGPSTPHIPNPRYFQTDRFPNGSTWFHLRWAVDLSDLEFEITLFESRKDGSPVCDIWLRRYYAEATDYKAPKCALMTQGVEDSKSRLVAFVMDSARVKTAKPQIMIEYGMYGFLRDIFIMNGGARP